MSQKIIEEHSKELQEFQEWIRSDPNLPQNLGEKTFFFIKR
jgi:hypothetical protein